MAVYFGTKDTVSKEIITYLCIFAAAPFAALGFIKYNGMPMEKLFWAWLTDNFLFPRKLTVKANNVYQKALTGYFADKDKEALNAEEHTDNTEAG